MTTFRSSFFRPWGALMQGSLVLVLLLAGWLGFTATVMWTNGNKRPFRKAAAVQEPLFALPAALTLLIGVPLVATSYAKSRGRYRLGPTALEVTEGWLGRETKTVPYAAINEVTTSRGPLMRLLGTTDLKLHCSEAPFWVTLHGVQGADEIRDHLLARRDSLRELKKEEEEASTLRAVERLAKVLERLEKRLG